jgi:RNA polymerase sigma-70 factor (ECF subfamily)
MTRVFALQPPPADPANAAPARLAGEPMPAVRAMPDEAAALYEAWAARVRGYVRFRVRDETDAEDLVADVFRRIVTQPIPGDPRARPAWIFRVAHNVVIDHYRRRRIPLLPDQFDRADDAPSLPDRVIHDERVRSTDEALRTLPGRQRAAIYLRYYEELAFDEVATVMGIPSSTARSLVHRGLKRLAILLGEEGER